MLTDFRSKLEQDRLRQRTYPARCTATLFRHLLWPWKPADSYRWPGSGNCCRSLATPEPPARHRPVAGHQPVEHGGGWLPTMALGRRHYQCESTLTTWKPPRGDWPRSTPGFLATRAGRHLGSIVKKRTAASSAKITDGPLSRSIATMTPAHSIGGSRERVTRP